MWRTMSNRINEFYWVRALSILMLFLVHSTLIMTDWSTMIYVQYFMLSNFFYVSGYLSFLGQKKGLRQFAKAEAVSLYLPFLIILALYKYVFAFPWFNEKSITAYFYHATLLSIFQQNSTGSYDLHHLWFIPVLLVFMFLFNALERTNNHLSVQVLVVAALFLGNSVVEYQFFMDAF
jgi:fucose 4-O-acetylase-like acetyltransferase